MSVQSALFRVAESSPAPVAPWIAGLALGRWPWRMRALPLATPDEFVVHCRRLVTGGELALSAEAAAEIFGALSTRDSGKLRQALGDPDGKRFAVSFGADGEVFVRVIS